jgi:hypothetical protein
MTPQQLNRFHTALNGLFDQATGEPSPCASNVLLISSYSRPGVVQFIPVATAEDRFASLFGDANLTAAPPGTPSCTPSYRPEISRRHSIPIAPAPCERLSPTAF